MSAALQELLAAERLFAATKQLAAQDSLGALHRARLELPQPADAAERIALWVVAPVLAAFTAWYADHATRLPEARLLGVMREGRLLIQLLPPELRPRAQTVWLNRNLTMRAAFGAGDDEALLNWLVRTRTQPARLHAVWPDLTGTLPDQSVPDCLLDLPTAQQCLQDWQRNGQLGAMRAHAAALGQNLLRHWDSVVTEKTAPILLLDFASVGNIQRALRTLLTARGEPDRLLGLNFITTAGTRWAQAQGCVLHGFLAEDGAPDWLAQAYARTPELIELFTAAPLGALQGMTDQGAPILAATFLSPGEQLRLASWQALILQSVPHYRRALGPALTTELGRCLWGRLLLTPTVAEAVALGDWPLDAGLDGGSQRMLAPAQPGPEPWDKMQSAWPAASRLRHALAAGERAGERV